jgi:hypothetical protein
MTFFRKLIALALLSSPAIAATITGTVTNKTTNKPAAGDEVILLKLGQGMDEAGRTKTDAAGKFSFKAEDGVPHLVRVIHQTVTYHAQVPPGQTTADVDVYDAAKKIDNLSATVQVMRFQAQGDKLQVTELYALKNASSPPRTLMADEAFQIALPEGAQVDDGQAISGTNGLPVTSAPVPSNKPGQYYFVFPIRPGETRFQVNYHLAYKGELAVSEKILYPMEHFVVMVPKSMTFTAANAALFQSMGDDPTSITQVSTSVKPGDTIAFKVAGTGEFPPEGEQAAQSGGGAPDSRPGGGLGPPIDAPDPLQQYRWYIIAGLAVAMVAGAFYVLNKRPVTGAAATAQVAAAAASRQPARAAAVTTPSPAPAASNGRSGMLMEALKEELFQLEIERQQGHITQAEYDKAKAALDVTIGRALNRAPAKKS